MRNQGRNVEHLTRRRLELVTPNTAKDSSGAGGRGRSPERVVALFVLRGHHEQISTCAWCDAHCPAAAKMAKTAQKQQKQCKGSKVGPAFVSA